MGVPLTVYEQLRIAKDVFFDDTWYNIAYGVQNVVDLADNFVASKKCRHLSRAITQFTGFIFFKIDNLKKSLLETVDYNNSMVDRFTASLDAIEYSCDSVTWCAAHSIMVLSAKAVFKLNFISYGLCWISYSVIVIKYIGQYCRGQEHLSLQDRVTMWNIAENISLLAYYILQGLVVLTLCTAAPSYSLWLYTVSEVAYYVDRYFRKRDEYVESLQEDNRRSMVGDPRLSDTV
jgi:hypothetical protein